MKLSGSRDRFKEAPWYNPDQSVTIGGVGSIGSWLTIFMGRLVNTIYIYDFDKVEEHNLSGQAYGVGNIDQEKSEAIKITSASLNPNTKIVRRGKFNKGSGVTPICFACFDNMKARRNMFESWKKLDNRKLFVDGRLTAEQYWLYAVTPDNEDKYDKEILLDDGEFEELPCSFKSTTHISAALASAMTTAFTNYCYNNQVDNIRTLPFESTFAASLFRYTID